MIQLAGVLTHFYGVDSFESFFIFQLYNMNYNYLAYLAARAVPLNKLSYFKYLNENFFLFSITFCCYIY